MVLLELQVLTWGLLCLWSCNNKISSRWKEVVLLKDLATSHHPRLPWGVNNPRVPDKTRRVGISSDRISSPQSGRHPCAQVLLPFQDILKFCKSQILQYNWEHRQAAPMSQAPTQSIWRMGTLFLSMADCMGKTGLETLSKWAQKWCSWGQRAALLDSWIFLFSFLYSPRFRSRKKKWKKGLAALPSSAWDGHMSSAE